VLVHPVYVELDEHDPSDQRLEEVKGELTDWRASVMRSPAGFLSMRIVGPVDSPHEAARTALVIAQAAAQRPARCVVVEKSGDPG
jgi:hypothetical protein